MVTAAAFLLIGGALESCDSKPTSSEVAQVNKETGSPTATIGFISVSDGDIIVVPIDNNIDCIVMESSGTNNQSMPCTNIGSYLKSSLNLQSSSHVSVMKSVQAPRQADLVYGRLINEGYKVELLVEKAPPPHLITLLPTNPTQGLASDR
jgi:hypothetical protein